MLRGLADAWTLENVCVWDGTGATHGAISFGAGGRVLAVGRADEVRTTAGGGEVVDGRGAFVCPGFVDPHVHVRAAASAALAVDVAQARGPNDLVSAVERTCRDDRSWATFVGLQTARRPHRGELDLVSRGVRVRIRDRTGHGWLLNSAALAAAGIDTAATHDTAPPGVLVERDRDRRPTGFVVDHVGWVGSRIGRVSEQAELTRAVGRWSRDLLRAGIVAFCDATATNGGRELRALHEWRRSGILMQEPTVLAAPGVRLEGAASRRVCGVKFAKASDPRLPPALRRARPDARFVAVHCVDAGETGAALAAAALAAPTRARLRLEHASFVPPDWLAEVSRARATVVTHPSFVTANGDRYLADDSLEPHDWLYRLASWRRAGVVLAFASDAPFGPASPLDALRAAASRRTASGATIGLQEALAGDDALQAVTSTAAACSGLSRLGYGRLAPGGPAAAVVLDRDPRLPLELEDTAVVATVIGGTVAA